MAESFPLGAGRPPSLFWNRALCQNLLTPNLPFILRYSVSGWAIVLRGVVRILEGNSGWDVQSFLAFFGNRPLTSHVSVKTVFFLSLLKQYRYPFLRIA